LVGSLKTYLGSSYFAPARSFVTPGQQEVISREINIKRKSEISFQHENPGQT
jgi:hypothetical protein